MQVNNVELLRMGQQTSLGLYTLNYPVKKKNNKKQSTKQTKMISNNNLSSHKNLFPLYPFDYDLIPLFTKVITRYISTCVEMWITEKSPPC